MILEDSVVSILAVVIPVIFAVIGFMAKNMLKTINIRLKDLESKVSVTEPQVRQIVADKIDPVKEDLGEIRKTLDYIFNYIFLKK